MPPVDLKYLADDSPVIVTGDGPDRTNELTGEKHPQLVIARLTTELVDTASVFDAPPAIAAEIGKGTAEQVSQIDALVASGALTEDEGNAAKARL